MFKLWLSFIWRFVLLLVVNGTVAAGLVFILPDSLIMAVVSLSWLTALAFSFVAFSWALSSNGIET